MDKEFNSEDAKKHLLMKEEQAQKGRKDERQAVLKLVLEVLKKEFQESGVEKISLLYSNSII